MCTRPQVITLLPSLCRTPACISTHLNRASLNVNVSARCVISLPSPHSCGRVHNSVLRKHPDWARAHFVKAPLQGPRWCLFGAPVRPVWPLNIGHWDQLLGWRGRVAGNLLATFAHNTESTLGSKSPFLFVHVAAEHVLIDKELRSAWITCSS